MALYRKSRKNILDGFQLKAVEGLAIRGIEEEKERKKAYCEQLRKEMGGRVGGACVSRINISLKSQVRRRLLKYCLDNIIQADFLTVRAIQHIEQSVFGYAWVEDRKHGREISNGADIAKEFKSYLEGSKTNGKNSLQDLKLEFEQINFDFRQLKKVYRDTCVFIENL